MSESVMNTTPSESNFVHLHVHSMYSLLDGMSKIPELVSKVKAMGMKSCALTDHGTCSGLVKFHDECIKQGIKPILGCEVYEAPGSMTEKTSKKGEDRYYHLILLVKNETGYRNLCHLVSRSNIDGFYYKPRIDFELLSEYHEGLICTSACVAGRIPSLILSGREDEAEEWILKYKDLFGDDFYLEIQDHGIRDEAIAFGAVVKLARRHGVKLVATNDSHYVNTEDKEAHDWLLCLQTQKTIHDEDRLTYHGDYSLKSEEEMRRLFPHLPDAIENTAEVAAKCDFTFHYASKPSEYRMPKVVIPPEYGNDYFRYMADEAWKGLGERYPEGSPWRWKAVERMKYELSVIKAMGFAEYFLDTRKTVLWAKSHGILVGPGRGSGAGSIMVYCLGITDIEPLKYGLLFERFLNPERASMPDIDIDYNPADKDRIIESEAVSNGKDRFAKIRTFTTMGAKGIVRDLARVAGYPVSTGAKLASLIPGDAQKSATLGEAWEINEDLRKYVGSDPGLKKLWDIALRLENLNKAESTHACGHIPTAVPCEDLFPVSVDSKTGYLVCQYDMTEVEHLGNLKKDILMLRNLTVIDVAMKDVEKKTGRKIPLWNEDVLNDRAALELIAAGDTNGIFQLESDGMKDFMRKLKPTCFEDIIAGVALYRPGPMDFIDDYIRGKHYPETIRYMVPGMEPILAPTYGVIVYQEQVMQIVQSLAGFTMGRADIVRKAMGKKKMDIMQEERKNFVYGNPDLGIPGCIANGIPEETANAIYDQMIDFAKYAFNKSHAAAYAAVSMQTAYIKAHYPLEFAAGLLSSVMDKTEKLVAYREEYERKGLKLQKPDVNKSGREFTAVDGEIIFGLTSIKNVGGGDVAKIIEEREKHGQYMSFSNFMMRCYSLNVRTVEFLVKAGALDSVNTEKPLSRRAMLESLKSVSAFYKKMAKNRTEGQMTIFDLFDSEEERRQEEFDVPDTEEYPKKELYALEKEATGFYVTGSPLDEYRRHMKAHGAVPLRLLTLENPELDRIPRMGFTIAGLITEVKPVFTKKDHRAMAIVTVDDGTGELRVPFFPDAYEKFAHLLFKDAPVMCRASMKISDEKGLSVIVDDAIRMDEKVDSLWIAIRSEREYNPCDSRIGNVRYRYRGGLGDLIVMARDTGRISVVAHGIQAEKYLEEVLANDFGRGNVRVVANRFSLFT